MSAGTQLAIDDFLTNVEDATEAAEERETEQSEFERLTGTKTLVQRQHADTDRVVDDSVSEDVARAMQDGHDFSDCGGDQS